VPRVGRRGEAPVLGLAVEKILVRPIGPRVNVPKHAPDSGEREMRGKEDRG
jgi:hypothetical protein